jgi:hypothetical protein
MNSRSRILFVLPVLLVVVGPIPALPDGQARTGSSDIARLASLLQADAFLEADKLAAVLLAGPSAAEPSALAVCGLAALKAGRIEEAEKILQKAAARSSEKPEASLGLGRIRRIRNDAAGSVEHLRRAVRSASFYEEALRQLWRAEWELGDVDALAEVRDLAVERFGRESKPVPSVFSNGFEQVSGLAGKRLFEMSGTFDRIDLPLLVDRERAPRIRMVSLALNGKGEFPFDIDSAAADFILLSPLLAEALGLSLTGSASAAGVGPDAAPVRFAVLDTVGLGPVTFRNVPVMVSDIAPFRGLRKGLLGTGLLKRFNVTIDVEAERLVLYPLDKPERLRASIGRSAVAADVPLHLFDQTVVEASVAGAPTALYLLDSAAAAHLMDAGFFAEHVRAKVDPSRLVRGGIRGAQGAQFVERIDGLTISLGPLALGGQSLHEFRMNELNAISGRYAAGLIGNLVLWPYRVHMDFAAGRLILEKRAAI